MDKAYVSDGQMHIFFMKAVTGNPKLHLDWKTLENTGNWYLYVHQFIKLVVFGWFCSNIFSNSKFFGVVDMNFITDAAIINRFLKHLFCNKSWFLDITQSKYIITRQQCLKSPEMLILPLWNIYWQEFLQRGWKSNEIISKEIDMNILQNTDCFFGLI